MSSIYLVCWEQSGDFNLSAVVIANSEPESIQAVSMYEPENIRCLKFGESDKDVIEPEVVCQESL